MHKLLLSIILILGSLNLVCAQDKSFEYADSSLLNEPGKTGNDNAELTEEKDILSDTTLYINRIEIPPDTVAGWKNDKRFAYIKALDSLLKIKQQEDLAANNERLKTKPNNFFRNLFASRIPQLFFWTVAIAFVLFILYKLFLSNGIFKRSTTSSIIVKEVPEEEVIATVADYDKSIQQAIAQQNYRLAVRYLFLKNLVHLADHEYVHYSPDKTNYQYVQEIRADRKNEFATLVLNYEYVWYGNFSLNSESYTGIEQKFNSFYNKIQ